MTENALFEKVREILIENHGVAPEKVKLETAFNNLGMDSLDALSLISALEEAFAIRIPNEDVLKIKTVGQAVEILEKHLA